ncbi:MAG: hypothetical protein ABSF49_05705 [Roseiarcus sp.]|jgi:hypothetical protein|uniref:hypothetical protein n=1 Tax=Roseiarcus sp. TaxID=1969460 RepID=UPI003C15DA82
MFAQAMHFATTPLRLVNADVPSCDYVDARAPRAQRVRLVGRWICAPDAPKLSCIWEVAKTGGASRRPPDGLRAA